MLLFSFVGCRLIPEGFIYLYKIISMTTIVVNERTAKGKSLLEFLSKFEGEKFIQIEKEPNMVTKRAIKDAREGKLIKCNSVSDLMDKLNV